MKDNFGKIAENLEKKGLDAMLITSDPGEFYAARFHGEGAAIITKAGSWYWTDSRYIESAQQKITGAEVAMPDYGVSYRKLVQEKIETLGIKKMGFEDEYMSVQSYNLWKKDVTAELVPASDLLTELRSVKDQDELAAMREAQRVTDEAFAEILQYIKPGVSEQEIAARLTFIMATKGAERNSFDPIVASGPNGSMPHAVPGPRLIQKGDFVTMDFGCVVGGYCSDMTRTVAVGEPTDEMRLVYNTVLKAQLEAIATIRGGVKGSTVHNTAAKVIADAGYGEYFGHGFGHSLGIEIHESPNFNPRNENPIPSGAFLSAEPGIYLPGKFGVRIEDVVMLTDDGYIDITNSPKELIIL